MYSRKTILKQLPNFTKTGRFLVKVIKKFLKTVYY